MGDDDVKRLILARRAKFVAAALAGLNAAMCGGKTDGPEVCLGPPYDGGREDGAPPQACLSPPMRDAGKDTGGDASDAGDGGDADAEPQPCLSPPLDGG